MIPRNLMKERLVDALSEASLPEDMPYFYRGSYHRSRDEVTAWLTEKSYEEDDEPEGLLAVGSGFDAFYDVVFDADKLADRVLSDAREILGVAALEAERDDLAEELDNLRSALRDRWSSVLPKGPQ